MPPLLHRDICGIGLSFWPIPATAAILESKGTGENKCPNDLSRSVTKCDTKTAFWQSFPSNMRILLLTENPVLALGLEAALLKAGHFASFSRPIYSSLLRCSTIAELREQLTASIESVDPPNVLVLDHAHVGMAVLKELNEEMKRVQTVLWADEIAVEFAYQSLTVGVRGILRKSWTGALRDSCAINARLLHTKVLVLR